VCGAGAWTQGLHLKPPHQPFLAMGFFKIGSHKLFAQAGFKPWSSWSLPPEQLGLQLSQWAPSLNILSKPYFSIENIVFIALRNIINLYQFVAIKAYIIIFLKFIKGQVWWYTFVIPSFGKLRKQGCEFETSLTYLAKKKKE
jgi:hypothetical protein